MRAQQRFSRKNEQLAWRPAAHERQLCPHIYLPGPLALQAKLDDGIALLQRARHASPVDQVTVFGGTDQAEHGRSVVLRRPAALTWIK
jgi:hypothetical protein